MNEYARYREERAKSWEPLDCCCRSTGGDEAGPIDGTRRCLDCGLIRADGQDPDLYDGRYHRETYTRSFDDEVQAARERLKYITVDQPALDVGAGLGGFVSVTGADGCDPGMMSQKILPRRFESARYPRRHYKTVTAFDVIEHVPDPYLFRDELARILADDGTLWIEIPDFRHGQHWKPEHLWYWTADQFSRFLEERFVVETQSRWPGKLLFVCRHKSVPQETVIAVPPGIGDAYWALMAAEEQGLTGEVAVYAASGPKKRRVAGLIQRYPEYRWGGYIPREKVGLGAGDPMWREAYKEAGRYLFRRPHKGCDMFISLNGNLREGVSVEDLGLAVRWHPDLHISAAENYWRQAYQGAVVFALTDNGFHRDWYKRWTNDVYYDRLAEIVRALGNHAIFVGAEWDREGVTAKALMAALEKRKVFVADMIGETSFDGMMGLIRGAKLVFGIASGLTIMSVAVRTPTIMLWSPPYIREFMKTACPPSREYLPLWTDDRCPEELVEQALAHAGN